MISEVRCNICNSSVLRRWLNLPSGHAIYVCQRCTNAATIPEPNQVYDRDEFFIHAQSNEALSRSHMTPIVNFIKEHIAAGRLLDVGTGSGLLVEEALKLGFEAEGIDPSQGAVRFCTNRGLRVKHGYLQHDSYSPHLFDVIVLSQVIEHMKEPGRLLETAQVFLKPGGMICLSQTNYQGTIPRLLGQRWQAWVPEQHFVHFSPQGIRFLLDRTGFRLIELRLLPLGYVFSKRRFFYSLGFFISKLRLGFPFVGDQMYILAAPTD